MARAPLQASVSASDVRKLIVSVEALRGSSGGIRKLWGEYLKQNLLAQSLHEKCYDHSPRFLRFIKEHHLPFKPHLQFKKADLDARQELYQKLADEIWNPERLRIELEAHA